MREIKFRGKKLKDNEWVYGDCYKKYIYINNFEGIQYYISWQIVDKNGIIYNEYAEVDSRTIGQYIDLKDKNDKEIYEDDIYKRKEDLYLVDYSNGFLWHQIYDSWLDRNVFKENRKSWILETFIDQIEIIGNIHENPELLNASVK